MPLEFDSATARLARSLQKTETAFDTALVEVAELLRDAALANADVKIASACQTHTTFLQLSKSIASLLDSKAQVDRAHGKFLEIYHETGATEECPDLVIGEKETAPTQLRA